MQFTKRLSVKRNISIPKCVGDDKKTERPNAAGTRHSGEYLARRMRVNIEEKSVMAFCA